MSTDYFGTNASDIMDKSQIFPHWYTHTDGRPEVLLKIPKSAISSARVPKPLGDSFPIGLNHLLNFIQPQEPEGQGSLWDLLRRGMIVGLFHLRDKAED
ncbi:hypothetical protein BSQ33_19670 [Vibrio gazogenes]|uniref:Uncharacterized protein n=1 Tax=Vibrio gazogenes TaxID=687 RepID=A0A1Z2SL87_VIBGA|nr:hypothetical protein BSQ33_19670 [Vibrio gazogenes]